MGFVGVFVVVCCFEVILGDRTASSLLLYTTVLCSVFKWLSF